MPSAQGLVPRHRAQCRLSPSPRSVFRCGRVLLSHALCGSVGTCALSAGLGFPEPGSF